jgi:hypothetical protein
MISWSSIVRTAAMPDFIYKADAFVRERLAADRHRSLDQEVTLLVTDGRGEPYRMSSRKGTPLYASDANERDRATGRLMAGCGRRTNL